MKIKTFKEFTFAASRNMQLSESVLNQRLIGSMDDFVEMLSALGSKSVSVVLTGINDEEIIFSCRLTK